MNCSKDSLESRMIEADAAIKGFDEDLKGDEIRYIPLNSLSALVSPIQAIF